MPALRVYEANPNANPNEVPVSITPGPTAGANPDDGVFDGNLGQSTAKQLWLGSERTTLDANILAGDLSLVTDDDRFSPGMVIKIGTEKILIGAKAGTTLSALTRGYAGTIAAGHTAGDTIYAAYDFTNLSIEAYDTNPPGDTSETNPVSGLPYYQFLNTNGPWGSGPTDEVRYPSVGGFALLHNASFSFYRRCNVRPATPTQTKQDIKIRVQGTQNPSA
jgi:hypothetical protein